MATATSVVTENITVTEPAGANQGRSPNVVLKLHKPKTSKQVKWDEGTVDNEHHNKKKSKCCCIYEKPRIFGESSSEDSDDECNGCHGHKKKCYKQLPQEDGASAEGSEKAS